MASIKDSGLLMEASLFKTSKMQSFAANLSLIFVIFQVAAHVMSQSHN
jgi:hypothetical protein